MPSSCVLVPVTIHSFVLTSSVTWLLGAFGRTVFDLTCNRAVVRQTIRFTSQPNTLSRSLGSLQACPGIPDEVKSVYRTVWDLDPIDLLDMAADRAPFVDQSQSLTLGIRHPSPELMVSPCYIHSSVPVQTRPLPMCLYMLQKNLMLHAWRAGLKTGLYYLRTLHPASMETELDLAQQPGSFGTRDCCA